MFFIHFILIQITLHGDHLVIKLSDFFITLMEDKLFSIFPLPLFQDKYKITTFLWLSQFGICMHPAVKLVGVVLNSPSLMLITLFLLNSQNLILSLELSAKKEILQLKKVGS
jgi:hypothetical protein